MNLEKKYHGFHKISTTVYNNDNKNKCYRNIILNCNNVSQYHFLTDCFILESRVKLH